MHLSTMEQVIEAVRERLDRLGLSEVEASRRIGVTSATLVRHLGGAHARSDSLAKYRRWLAGDQAHAGLETIEPSGQLTLAVPAEVLRFETSRPEVLPDIEPPAKPHRVVDLFSGCGGLSLGFEKARGGHVFYTTLAVDIEEPMVRVFNDNHPVETDRGAHGRQADLSDFLHESEVLAYYLLHLAELDADKPLFEELKAAGLDGFLQAVQTCDDAFTQCLVEARSRDAYRSTYDVVRSALSQTAVVGFHSTLKLPSPTRGAPRFGPLLWRNRCNSVGEPAMDVPPKLQRKWTSTAESTWQNELRRLRARADATGAGQLASSARRIRQALRLLEGDAYAPVRTAWIAWKGERDALRDAFFNDDKLAELREVYRGDRRVRVLLGGPPCQGFSRIGRGKIRSLRDQELHVQTDERAGDSRNELLHHYVLFVSALMPDVFLFENVRHFQSEVITPDGTFKATDVLAEAIESISSDHLRYQVASRILSAAKHGVPQTRERYFMVGLRDQVVRAGPIDDAAEWCLDLPHREPVTLLSALAGLPEPTVRRGRKEDKAPVVTVDQLQMQASGSTGEYFGWTRREDGKPVDAHWTRDSRKDDEDFFALLGPGKRWMDYRCDGDPIIEELGRLLAWAEAAADAGPVAGLTRERLAELTSVVDGSLSIRLLLNRIDRPPGELEHHLCAPSYMKKRDGNHGDWLSRMDPDKPAKSVVSHMAKDAYAYIHPFSARTISVREAARIQSFPDQYSFDTVGLTDGYRVVGNAVPPLLSRHLADRVAVVLYQADAAGQLDSSPRKASS